MDGIKLTRRIIPGRINAVGGVVAVRFTKLPAALNKGAPLAGANGALGLWPFIRRLRHRQFDATALRAAGEVSPSGVALRQVQTAAFYRFRRTGQQQRRVELALLG
jgi:hypothetical protein